MLPFDYIDHLKQKNFSLFDRVTTKTRVFQLIINHNLKIPNFDCDTIEIQDRNLDKKIYAASEIMEHFLSKHQKNMRNKALRILIPEHLVSIFIGKDGKNIIRLKESCGTQITVY